MSVDKLVDSTALDAGLTSIANAIRQKSGSDKQLSFPDGFVDEIRDINTVVDDIPIDDVTFVDYDGTVLYTYSADEFMELTEMPANPSHTGLVAQGWNWTLAGAKEYVGENECLCIGQNYTTDDGCTRIYVRIQDYLLDCPLYICMCTSAKGGVTIDWGDGHTTITDANASVYKAYSHVYDMAGDYVVELECTSGIYELGYNGSNSGIFAQSENYISFCSAREIIKIECGDNLTRLHRQGLNNCCSLESISIPSTLINYGTGTIGSVFQQNIALSCVVFPSGSTICGANNFNEVYSIKFISYGEIMTMPTNYAENNNMKSLRMFTTPHLETIGTNFCSWAYQLEYFAAPGTYVTATNTFCRDNYKLRKIILPESVTTISDYAFTDNPLKEFHVRSTTPPTIANTRGMPHISALNGVIYVPYSADHSILEAYKTATNWSTYAQYMQEESQS